MKRPTLRDLAQRHHTADWRAVPVVVRSDAGTVEEVTAEIVRVVKEVVG